MGKTLIYKIKFHTDWHCGSGLAAGADVDALVVKDVHGLPFVPGKTMKGLLREAVDVLYGKKDEAYQRLFGSLPVKGGEVLAEETMAESFFSNAVLDEDTQQVILKNDLKEFMFRSLSATAIDDEGIACEGSLRKIQVAVPCVLYAKVTDVPDEMRNVLVKALGYIKRLGLCRTRGLGRCTLSEVKQEE